MERLNNPCGYLGSDRSVAVWYAQCMSIELIRAKAVSLRKDRPQVTTLYGVNLNDLDGDDLRDAMVVICHLHEEGMDNYFKSKLSPASTD